MSFYLFHGARGRSSKASETMISPKPMSLSCLSSARASMTRSMSISPAGFWMSSPCNTKMMRSSLEAMWIWVVLRAST